MSFRKGTGFCFAALEEGDAPEAVGESLFCDAWPIFVVRQGKLSWGAHRAVASSVFTKKSRGVTLLVTLGVCR